MDEQSVSVSNGFDVPDEVIERCARMLFDRANPEVPGHITHINRDLWFSESRDYWVRAIRELAEQLGTPMAVQCPCGYSATGPASEVRRTVFMHKCEKTDPSAWNKHGTGWIE